jgi:5-hydroxyisourate hydrolase-like protein (transthyretin family)
MKESDDKIEVIFSTGKHVTQMGYRFTVRVKAYWTAAGDKKMKGDKFFKVVFVSGTNDSVRKAAKTFVEKFVSLMEGRIQGKRNPFGDMVYFTLKWEDAEAAINAIEALDLKYTPTFVAAPFEPVILKFKEKHGDRHYVPKTPDEVYRIFLEVLEDRNDQGWYSWYKDMKNDTPKPKYTRSEVNGLPESMEKVKPTLIKEIENWEAAEKVTKEFHELGAKIAKAIADKDGRLAYEIIENNREGEYEGFEFIEPDTI